MLAQGYRPDKRFWPPNLTAWFPNLATNFIWWVNIWSSLLRQPHFKGSVVEGLWQVFTLNPWGSVAPLQWSYINSMAEWLLSVAQWDPQQTCLNVRSILKEEYENKRSSQNTVTFVLVRKGLVLTFGSHGHIHPLYPLGLGLYLLLSQTAQSEGTETKKKGESVTNGVHERNPATQ